MGVPERKEDINLQVKVLPKLLVQALKPDRLDSDRFIGLLVPGPEDLCKGALADYLIDNKLIIASGAADDIAWLVRGTRIARGMLSTRHGYSRAKGGNDYVLVGRGRRYLSARSGRKA